MWLITRLIAIRYIFKPSNWHDLNRSSLSDVTAGAVGFLNFCLESARSWVWDVKKVEMLPNWQIIMQFQGSGIVQKCSSVCLNLWIEVFNVWNFQDIERNSGWAHNNGVAPTPPHVFLPQPRPQHPSHTSGAVSYQGQAWISCALILRARHLRSVRVANVDRGQIGLGNDARFAK